MTPPEEQAVQGFEGNGDQPEEAVGEPPGMDEEFNREEYEQ